MGNVKFMGKSGVIHLGFLLLGEEEKMKILLFILGSICIIIAAIIAIHEDQDKSFEVRVEDTVHHGEEHPEITYVEW